MRKDYAKTKKGVKPKTNYRAASVTRTSRTKKKKQSAGLPVFGAVLVLAVIGGLVALRVTHHGSLLQKAAVSAENSNTSSAANKSPKEINTLPPVEVAEPTFDFYDVLPGESKPSKRSTAAATSRETASPTTTAPTVSQKAPTTATHPGTTDTYTIQVASFAQDKEAQLFKQRLVYATGHTPTIENVLLNGSHVYRVSLGPYSSLNAAMIDSNQLKQLGFTNILHRRAANTHVT
jgi:cell division protein FtsN